VVAAPLLVVSVCAFALAGIAWINAHLGGSGLDYIAIGESPRGHIIFIDPPCEIRDIFRSSRAICAVEQSFVWLRFACVSTLIACVWYAACWPIGRVLAGFARDDNVMVEPRR
jgi:hypothetical protein